MDKRKVITDLLSGDLARIRTAKEQLQGNPSPDFVRLFRNLMAPSNMSSSDLESAQLRKDEREFLNQFYSPNDE